MRSFFWLALFVLCLVLPLSAEMPPEQRSPVQISLPETAYLGDTVEIRYIFYADTDLIGGDGAHADLPTDLPAFAAQREHCTVLSASLDRLGSAYTLTVRLVGWKVGTITFAPFSIGSHMVLLDPIAVNSIVEKSGARGFRPPSPPLAVPGTTAAFVVIAVLFLLVLVAALFVLLHLSAFADFFAARRARRKMRVVLKKLRALAVRSDDTDDRQFCAAVQHILRGYLSERFACPFAAVETGGLYAAVSAICGGALDGAQDAMLEELLYLFNRTDYIRYAHADLPAGEKELLLSVAVDAVESIGGAHGDL